MEHRRPEVEAVGIHQLQHRRQQTCGEAQVDIARRTQAERAHADPIGVGQHLNDPHRRQGIKDRPDRHHRHMGPKERAMADQQRPPDDHRRNDSQEPVDPIHLEGADLCHPRRHRPQGLHHEQGHGQGQRQPLQDGSIEVREGEDHDRQQGRHQKQREVPLLGMDRRSREPQGSADLHGRISSIKAWACACSRRGKGAYPKVFTCSCPSRESP